MMLHSSQRQRYFLLPDFSQLPTKIIALAVSCLVLAAGDFTTALVAQEIVGQQNHEDRTPSYNRDVRPILSENCFSCHGLDSEAREANLRLDERSSAIQSGAMVPGKPNESELVARITSEDAEAVMPPPETGHQLTVSQISTLKSWIASGATYEKHWSFLAPEKSTLPSHSKVEGVANPIDSFILARVEQAGLTPAPLADRATILRRLALDLTGLPPTPELAKSFLDEEKPISYEMLVNRLLDSDRYGEHWARMWLDLARYADTKGYEKDRHRNIWRYRDWVIDAFNRDLPFDQFTIEQLGGDLLPNRTDDQILATAFHRNTMTNDEGGTDNEEFRIAAVKDRVDTTLQVWMGLTMGCAKCHSHKYDPITIQDYYSFFAYFNQTRDADNEAPFHPTPTAIQAAKLKELTSQLDQATRLANQRPDGFSEEFEQWKSTLKQRPLWQPLNLKDFKSENGVVLNQDKEHRLIASGDRPEKDTWQITFDLPVVSKDDRYTSFRIDHFPKSVAGGDWEDKNVAIRELTLELETPDGESKKLTLKNPRASFSQHRWNVAFALDGKTDAGWALSPHFGKRQTAVFDFETPISGGTLKVTLEQKYGEGLLLARSRFSISRNPVSWLRAEVEPDQEDTFVKAVFPETIKRLKAKQTAQDQLQNFKKQIPSTPVMFDLDSKQHRTTRIHNRGNFLDQGAEVKASVLTGFAEFPSSAPSNRLGVAHWLMQPDNPLTARVAVNRIWARLFGTGLVETEEDFGTQGMPPSHPALLDWLAVDFREQGWSFKQLLKTIVMSRTYRQSSVVTEESLRLDPRNRLLLRGPRFRLSAEMVRDQALAVSGLLVHKIGGPSVMPPQPPGIWKSTYSGEKWKNAAGDDRYRRGLYTYLKRTSPYPSMTTFDAGSGEVCQIRRIRTNTPLQALITLNDVVYLEAAGRLAQRMEAAGSDLNSRIAAGFRMVLVRDADESEVARLNRLYHSLEEELSEGSELLESAQITNVDPRLVAIANVLLNLDETLMKP